jgi:hypothetical protein
MARTVEEICQQFVKDTKLVASCNEFLQSVAAEVGREYNVKDIATAFSGNANAIRSRFSSADGTQKPFIYIGTNPTLATKYADAGQFVVGGLTSTEMTYTGRDKREHKASMGHVVVVAPGGPSKPCHIKLMNGVDQAVRGGYPYCYQGAAHEIYRFTERTQVDAVFPALLLNKVIYAYIAIKAA